MQSAQLNKGPAMQSQILESTDLVDADSLKDGIWPRSLALWFAGVYFALYIIRPWEVLFPWLAVIHPERIYMLCMITVVFLVKGNIFRLTWQTMAVVMFFASVALASVCAINPALSWEPFYAYFAVVVFYFILLRVIKTPYDLAFIILCYIAVMCVYLAKAEWEFFVNGQHRYDMGVVRMEGIETTFGGPNNLGISINASLPFALFLWRQRAVFTESWPGKWRQWCHYGLILYGCLAVTSIILTNSRSTMIGFVVFISVLIFEGKGIVKKSKYLVAVIITLATIWTLMPAENKGRLSTVWAPEEGPANAQESAEGRIEGYKAGMEMFRRFPLTGVGLGNYIPYRVSSVDGVALEAHNLVGQLLGETGLVGGITFSLMLAAVLITSGKIIKYSKIRPDPKLSFFSDLAVACRRSLFLLLFLGLFGHNLYRANWLWLVAFTLLALRFTEEIFISKRDNLSWIS